MKRSRRCLITFPNRKKLVKNTPLRFIFSTHFSVFGNVENVVKQGLSCRFDILLVRIIDLGLDFEKNIILRVENL